MWSPSKGAWCPQGLESEIKMAEMAQCKLTNIRKQFKSSIDGNSGNAGPSTKKPGME